MGVSNILNAWRAHKIQCGLVWSRFLGMFPRHSPVLCQWRANPVWVLDAGTRALKWHTGLSDGSSLMLTWQTSTGSIPTVVWLWCWFPRLLRAGQGRKDFDSVDNEVLARPDADLGDLNSWSWKRCRPSGWGNTMVRIKKDEGERGSWGWTLWGARWKVGLPRWVALSSLERW